MKKNNLKAWLYLLPAILFLGVFMVYPLIDVCFYSLEENYHSISQTYTGVGLGNYVRRLAAPLCEEALRVSCARREGAGRRRGVALGA